VSAFSLNAQIISSGLSSPWGMAYLPDGRWLITQRAGSLVIVGTDGRVSNAITGVPEVYSGGQGGLLDLSLAPDFASSRKIYFSYAEQRAEGKNGTSVAWARLSADETRLEEWRVIFRQEPAWNSGLHFGSRLAWDKNGLLYVTLGERSTLESRPLAQDINTHLGKVIRIKADGSTPADNPFVNTANAKTEVWSYGHRNPQGAAIHPKTGALWTLEHGPRGGDEVNHPEAGKNYGWPIITYGIDYGGGPIGEGITAKNGMEQPVYFWDPVIAPSDIVFYQGALFPEWNGNLFIASLNPGGIVRLVLNDDQVVAEERLLREWGRVRDVSLAPDGALWLVNDSGQLVRTTRK
jgi:glucose/arabinose dehydrogenase